MDKRTKLIEKSLTEEHKRRIPSVSWLYLVETRISYIFGLEISCVVMMMMAFEELFRSILSFEDSELYFGGKKIKIDNLNFNELLEIAITKSWITRSEYEKLNKLRKIRNKFTHVKGSKIRDSQKPLEITRQSMEAEFFMPSVDFTNLSKQAIKLIPLFFKVLDKNFIPLGLEFRKAK